MRNSIIVIIIIALLAKVNIVKAGESESNQIIRENRGVEDREMEMIRQRFQRTCTRRKQVMVRVERESERGYYEIGTRIEKAIGRAKKIENYYKEKGKNIQELQNRIGEVESRYKLIQEEYNNHYNLLEELIEDNCEGEIEEYKEKVRILKEGRVKIKESLGAIKIDIKDKILVEIIKLNK